jgi:1-acyl-sn-glycerol-3-phosphate acyltransferase
MQGNTLSLLKEKRFLPLFVTQFLGAFNDNIFKNALIMMVVYKLVTDSNFYVNLAAGLFILPFFLFSATAGQIAEKYEKSLVIKVNKFCEIIIMLCASVCFYFDSVNGLIAMLFLMGTQSAFFGPLKYSILPQHLDEKEIIAGNGIIEMGTFLAILLGTMLGVYLITENNGEFLVSIAVLAVAVFGFISSLFIPKAESVNSQLKINFNLYSATKEVLSIFKQQVPSVKMSVIAVSWFWFLGAIYLTQLPQLVKSEMGYSEDVVTLFLVVFSIGIGLGSMLCERISKDYIEVGLVAFGSFGITFFGALFFYEFTTFDSMALMKDGNLLSLADYNEDPRSIFLCIYLFAIGLFGGFYTVPLYAIIQTRSVKEHMSRIIAANNIFNSLFMVVSAIMAVVLLKWLSIAQLFLVLSLANWIVAFYIYKKIPEFYLRFITWFVLTFMYRIKTNGLANIPKEGKIVIVANHVSFIDALLLVSVIKRPIRFVMYYKIFNIPVLNWLFRQMGAVPIAGVKESPEILSQCFDKLNEYLENGEVVCIFPEGFITYDGEIQPFKAGIERIVNTSKSPVIPVALKGIYGSIFSRKHKLRYPRTMFRKITVEIGEPIPAELAQRDYLHERVKDLMKK